MPIPTLQLTLRAVAAIVLLDVSAPADEREQFFERQIRPLLIDNCVSCHGPDKQEGGLRIDSRQQVLNGAPDVDALVISKNAADSRLLQVMLYSDSDVQMPPKKKLTESQIAAVKHWIESGAVWPENTEFGHAGAVDLDAWKRHWAFQPITDPPLPTTDRDVQHPIDAFVRRTLNNKSIAPSPPADARALVRRLSFAVVGLPPKFKDINTASAIQDASELNPWLNDYADRLLATPQFGERWGRYWLDIARYADTKGYVFREDREYKDAWRYREWVIRSLNDDMPYDEFLRRQIAADKLPGSDDPAQLAAMGFFTLGRRFLNNQQDIIDDRIDVLSRGTLGLTVACARCHDHKFDPIPTADYYSLYGVFNSSKEPKDDPSPLRLVDHDKPREPVIFVRGNAGNRGARVSRHFLTALSDGVPQPFTDGSGRLELANAITAKDNPLAARVAVNRIWLRLFGQGLVDSPSDFGVRTPPPSHPELLDHLATYFISHQWSRKSVIRYILASNTWRQSSQSRSDVSNDDPENRLLSRMPRRRLNFEAYRDSVLTACGNLDTTVGGPSVDILTQPFTSRRTIYARIDRQNLPGTFRTFDFASPDTLSASRFETTVPQQALFQLNSPFIMHQAEQAESALNGSDTTAKIRDLYTNILLRAPTDQESNQATLFLKLTGIQRAKAEIISGWQYGWGELNAQKNTVLKFNPFTEFHEGRFSGGVKLPDPQIGWTMLNRDGGHPGGNLQLCSIRRWVADQDCTVHINGKLEHATEHGDGITGHVIVGNSSKVTVHTHNNQRSVAVKRFAIKAGDTIDFVADCGANESHDSFVWRIRLQQSADDVELRTWDSKNDFPTAPAATLLSPIQQLAQTLLLTNEFMFVD